MARERLDEQGGELLREQSIKCSDVRRPAA
jgi:hypothetical protein